MSKFIICIARSCGSGGTLIGNVLSERYGVNIYGREILKMASQESGISEDLFYKSDEKVKNSLLYYVSKTVYRNDLIPPNSSGFTNDNNLFNYQADVLKKLADEESYIVVGRAADFILRDYPNVFKIFVYASMEKCIEVQMDRLGYTEKEAEKYIRKMDKERNEYYLHYTGQKWQDPFNYDLCINSTDISYEEGANVIDSLITQKMARK